MEELWRADAGGSKRKIEERAESYQEDFMFMGGKAFAYYYPVIDTCLRETPCLTAEDRDDRQAWILPQCIKHQFREWNYRDVRHLKRDVFDFCRFVRGKLTLFGSESANLKNIDEQWADLQHHLETTNDRTNNPIDRSGGSAA